MVKLCEALCNYEHTGTGNMLQFVTLHDTCVGQAQIKAMETGSP